MLYKHFKKERYFQALSQESSPPPAGGLQDLEPTLPLSVGVQKAEDHPKTVLEFGWDAQGLALTENPPGYSCLGSGHSWIFK